MKASSTDKWHCHFHNNAICFLLLFALSFHTGYGIGEIHLHTTYFDESGELHIPEVKYTPLIEKEINQCPTQFKNLPIVGCELMDNVGRERSATNSHHYLLKFKHLDRGAFPPLDATDGMRIAGIEASDGGLQNLDSSLLRDVPHLEVLSLSKHWINKIENIDHVFNGTKQLWKLNLECNGIITWTVSDEVADHTLQELEELNLSGNPIEYFTNRSFEWLKNSKLRTLILRECNSLMGIDPGMLFPVSASLRVLDLARSGMGRQLLVNLTKGVKETRNFSIEALGMAKTGITEIPRSLLHSLASSLKYLSLYGNRITMKSSWVPYVMKVTNGSGDNMITEDENLLSSEHHSVHGPYLPPEMAEEMSDEMFHSLEDIMDRPPNSELNETGAGFPYMPYLEELDLRSASVKFLPFHILNPLPNLTTLLLGMNEIMQLSRRNFRNNKNLTFLSITENDNGDHLLLGRRVFSDLQKLKYLDLSLTPLLPLNDSTFAGLHELRELSLYSTRLETLPDGIFSELENLRVLNISHNTMKNLDRNPFEGLSGLQELYATNCNLNFNEVNLSYFSNLQTLDLTHNYVERLDHFTTRNMPKLTKLDLTENKILTWQQPVISESTIRELILAKNLINEITVSMLSDFNNSNLRSVDATDNPFMCYCTMKDLNDSLPQLKNWPQGYKCQNKGNGLIHLTDITDENCMKSVGIQEKDKQDGRPSPSKSTILTVSVASAGAIIIVVAAFCYWKWWHIRTCARVLRSTALFSIAENEDVGKSNKEEKFQYDVFVSYSDPDRRWIMDYLLPNLETNFQIKVCLHERDFQAGVSILENIMACMEQSRCILLVISKAFLRSHWCLFELNMAQHRLLQMNRDHLLLVLLEDIPRKQCTKMMRYLMLSKTYLRWPIKDQEEQQQFWKRLHKAVGAPQDTNVSIV